VTESIRIGLYGGSFDPIHNGHLIIARAVAEALHLQRIIFLPSARPPHKDAADLSDADHRAAMVKIAIRGETLLEFDEFDLRRSGPTYTIDTVAHFQGMLGHGVDISWIIGADSLVELASWHRVADLVDGCRIVTAARPGWEAPDLTPLASKLAPRQIERLRQGIVETPRIDISATDIRRRVRCGLSVRYLAPDGVLDYIKEQGLYVRQSEPFTGIGGQSPPYDLTGQTPP